MLWYYLSGEDEKQRQKKKGSHGYQACTVTKILGVQQNKYSLKNLVDIGKPEPSAKLTRAKRESVSKNFTSASSTSFLWRQAVLESLLSL